MKYRLRDVIDSLEFDELIKMKKDLEYGGHHLKTFVDIKIDEEKRKHSLVCSVCTNQIKPESTNNYTLTFGPESFLKKASFCGIDCLENFIDDLKKIKKVVQ